MTSPSLTPMGDDLTVAVGPDEGRFDVREFARTAVGSLRPTLDLEAVARAGVGPDPARLIRILRDLERATMARMRNLLVTATHKDARVTAFLTTWAYEKFWIADALDAVLEATGNPLTTPAGPPRASIAESAERRGPVLRAIAGNIAGVRLVAAHVTTGLIDEWVTAAAYRRLAQLNSGLQPLVDRVLAIKQRHSRFLAEEAQRRLGESSRARRLSRRAVQQAAWPVGAVDLPAAERGFLEALVFGDADGRSAAARLSDLVAELPGLRPVAPTLTARLVP